jgi:hypothetical protein
MEGRQCNYARINMLAVIMNAINDNYNAND